MTPTKLRCIGLLPMFGFAIHFQSQLRQGKPDEALWICYATSLALAFALFSGRAFFIAPTALCLIVAFPLWLIETFVIFEASWTSSCAHLFGFATAIYALRAIQLPAFSWLHAIGWGCLVQQIARVATDPEKNINAAHRVYAGMDVLFPTYVIFWIVSFIGCVAALWAVQRLFRTPQEIGSQLERDSVDLAPET